MLSGQTTAIIKALHGLNRLTPRAKPALLVLPPRRTELSRDSHPDQEQNPPWFRIQNLVVLQKLTNQSVQLIIRNQQ